MWKFDHDASREWRKGSVDGPTQYLNRIRMFHDPIGRRIVLVGYGEEFDSTGFMHTPLQLYALPLEGERRWVELPAGGDVPLSRHGASVAFDANSQVLYLLGGHAGGFDRFECPDELYACDIAGSATWSLVDVEGEPLTGEVGYAYFDASSRRLVAYGVRDTLDDGDDFRVRVLPVDGDRRWVTLSPNRLVAVPAREATHDPVTDRLLVVHAANPGQPVDSSYGLAFEAGGNGTWTRIPFSGSRHPFTGGRARYCVDPASHTLVVYGGLERLPIQGAPNLRFLADVWSVPLTGSGGWTTLYESIASNGVALGSPAVFDPARRRILAVDASFDSQNPGLVVFYQDGIASWSRAACAAPGPPQGRDGAVAVFDPSGDRMILFGGGALSLEFGDLWELSFAFSPPRWRRLLDHEDVPRPRRDASAIYDPQRRRMVLFGGYAGEPMNDTWVLDLASADPVWRGLATRGAPPPARSRHSAVYDSRRDGMIVHAGVADSPNAPLDDTWFLSFADCDTWVPLSTEGSTPAARSGHGALYDPVADRMLILGGRDGLATPSDHHALELGTPSRWAPFQPAGTPPLSGNTSALYDAASDRAFLLHPDQRGRVDGLTWNRDTTPVPILGTGGEFRLLVVGPNPSAGEVNITFELPRSAVVATWVYDVRGRLVRDLGATLHAPGPHLVCWDGHAASGERLRDGVYFARMVVEGKAISGKIVLLH